METISCPDRFHFDWHIVYHYAEDVQPLLPCDAKIHTIFCVLSRPFKTVTLKTACRLGNAKLEDHSSAHSGVRSLTKLGTSRGRRKTFERGRDRELCVNQARRGHPLPAMFARIAILIAVGESRAANTSLVCALPAKAQHKKVTLTALSKLCDRIRTWLSRPGLLSIGISLVQRFCPGATVTITSCGVSNRPSLAMARSQ